MSKRKPTVAAVEKVIRDYEKMVLNPVMGWLRMCGEDTEPLGLADDLAMVHRGLRILRDDIAQGLVDWEETREG